jgi:hypothetical protein
MEEHDPEEKNDINPRTSNGLAAKEEVGVL